MEGWARDLSIVHSLSMGIIDINDLSLCFNHKEYFKACSSMSDL
jgi:hypothetical protein